MRDRLLSLSEIERYHEYLRWPGTTGELESLAETAPEPGPRETGDVHDPRPWLEAYAAGVGSPLELKFLRLFEQQGIKVEKQVPVAPDDAGLPISVADFAIPGRRVAVYVDGASFHAGSNLRRDLFIRERLRTGSRPWHVVELRATDLQYPARVVARLQVG